MKVDKIFGGEANEDVKSRIRKARAAQEHLENQGSDKTNKHKIFYQQCQCNLLVLGGRMATIERIQTFIN